MWKVDKRPTYFLNYYNERNKQYKFCSQCWTIALCKIVFFDENAPSFLCFLRGEMSLFVTQNCSLWDWYETLKHQNKEGYNVPHTICLQITCIEKGWYVKFLRFALVLRSSSWLDRAIIITWFLEILDKAAILTSIFLL